MKDKTKDKLVELTETLVGARMHAFNCKRMKDEAYRQYEEAAALEAKAMGALEEARTRLEDHIKSIEIEGI